MYQNSLGIMPNVLYTDPILSVPNVTRVPNVNTVPNVPKMTNNDPNNVPKTQCTNWCRPSVLNGVPNVKCTKVQQVYQNLLGMTPSVVNTDPILSVPKCNWCSTKRDDYANITQNDQERC